MSEGTPLAKEFPELFEQETVWLVDTDKLSGPSYFLPSPFDLKESKSPRISRWLERLAWWIEGNHV